jgi:hypothetical protein
MSMTLNNDDDLRALIQNNTHFDMMGEIVKKFYFRNSVKNPHQHGTVAW